MPASRKLARMHAELLGRVALDEAEEVDFVADTPRRRRCSSERRESARARPSTRPRSRPPSSCVNWGQKRQRPCVHTLAQHRLDLGEVVADEVLRHEPAVGTTATGSSQIDSP